MSSSLYNEGVGIDKVLIEKVKELGDKAYEFLPNIVHGEKKAADQAIRDLVNEEIVNDYHVKREEIHSKIKKLVPELENMTGSEWSEKEAAFLLYKESSERIQEHEEKFKRLERVKELDKAHIELSSISRLLEITTEIKKKYGTELDNCKVDHLSLIFGEVEKEIEFANSSSREIKAEEIEKKSLEALREMRKRNSEIGNHLDHMKKRISIEAHGLP